MAASGEGDHEKISLSLRLSFFVSPCPPFLFHALHMNLLHVLMSKSDHLQDLATFVFGCVSSLLPTLYSGVSTRFCSFFRPPSWDAQREIYRFPILNQ